MFDQDTHHIDKSEYTSKANGEYCITTGDKLLHHLTYQQIITIYQQINRLYIPFYMLSAQEEENPEIEISQFTEIREDSRIPFVFYSLYSNDCEIQMVSYSHLKKIAEMLQTFLSEYGETSHDQNGHLTSLSLHNPPLSSHLPLQIWKDNMPQNRIPVFQTPPQINKRIAQSSLRSQIQIQYMLSANELTSVWLTEEELRLLHQKIGEFLQHHPLPDSDQ